MSQPTRSASRPAPASARNTLKSSLSRLLRHPPLNAAMRVVLRPFAGAVPLEQLMRLPIVGTVRAKLPSGSELKLDSDGRDAIASAIYWRGLEAWEPETFRILDRILPTADVVFDVGANSGLFALYAALERPQCRVLAFEPTPSSSASLARNIEVKRT